MPDHAITAISVAEMKKAGLFKLPNMPGFKRSDLTLGDWWLRFADMTVRCRLAEDWSAILVMVDPIGIHLTIRLEHLPTGRGERPYFICSCCNRRRTHMFVVGKEVLCREGYITSRKTRGKLDHLIDLRIAERAKPIIVPAPTTERAEQKIQAAQQPAAAPAALPKKKRAPKVRNANSTSFAIDNGRGANQYDLYFQYLDQPTHHWRGVGLEDIYNSPDAPAILDNFPALDMNIFSSSLIRCREGVTATTLCWGDRSRRYVEPLFLIDWREGHPLFLACLDFTDPDRRRWQQLEVHCQKNGRLRWICPVTGKNTDILYLRNASFASRQAQRLVSASQRAAGRKARGQQQAAQAATVFQLTTRPHRL